MAEEAQRLLRVGSDTDALIRVLGEHRSAAQGWRIEPLGSGADLTADTLLLLDFADAETPRRTIDTVRARGFVGHVMIIGARGGTAPDEEPLPRPIRVGALLARLDAHWARRMEAAPIELGPYVFVPENPILRDGEGEIRLTELECRLLTYLADAEGDLVAREQLLAGVWGYSASVDTHTVETHIWRLRQKIETDDPATHFLLTEAGGYRLLMGGEAG